MFGRPSIEGWSPTLAESVQSLRMDLTKIKRFQELARRGSRRPLSVVEEFEIERYRIAASSLAWLKCQAALYLQGGETALFGPSGSNDPS